MGTLLPQGACPARMHPPNSLLSCQKRNGPCTVQREKRWRAPVQWPSARAGDGVSVQALIWTGLRARYSLLRVCNCRPVADGAEDVGVVIVLPLLLFSLPLTWWLTEAGTTGR